MTDMMIGMMKNGFPSCVGQHVGPHARRSTCELPPRCAVYDGDGEMMVAPDDAPDYVTRGRHTIAPHRKTSGCNVDPLCRPAGITQPGPYIDDDAVAGVGADGPEPVQPWDAAYRPPPSHYAADGIDPWAIWRAFDLNPWEANLVKYVCRAGKKPGESRLKDLLKAKDYLNYLIEQEELNDGRGTEGA